MSENGWHLRKEVSLAHIITTLSVMGAAVAYIISIDKRISVIELSADLNRGVFEQRFNRSEARQSARFAEIKSALVRIEDKLDRKADKP